MPHPRIASCAQEQVQELQQELARAQLRIAALEVHRDEHHDDRYPDADQADSYHSYHADNDLPLPVDLFDQHRNRQRSSRGKPGGAGAGYGAASFGQEVAALAGSSDQAQQGHGELEELWQRLHDMLVEDAHRAQARRLKQQRRERQHQQRDQQRQGGESQQQEHRDAGVQEELQGRGMASGNSLAMVSAGPLGHQVMGGPEGEEAVASTIEDLAELLHAWERGDRLRLLQQAVHCMHGLRQQNRCMARLLRRVEREGPRLGRLEALHQDNKDLLCKYLTAQVRGLGCPRVHAVVAALG